MSRRRRRNSRRRKSSSCSKQSICPYNFPKHARTPSDDVGLRDEHAEKGEADSLHKENSLCKSDAEEEKEEDTETPCAKKRLRQDSAVGCFNSNARRQADISSDGTTSEGDQGVRITTSVTINNLEQNTSQIVFQRSHSSSAVGLGNSTIAITTTKLEGIHANMKIEIRELLQVDNSDYKTTFVLQGQKAKDTEASSENQQYGFQIPNNESFTFSYPWSQRTNQNDSKTEKPFENMSCVFSVVEMSNEGADTSRSSVPTMCHSEDTACYKSCCQDHCDGYSHFSHYDTDFTLVDGSSSLSTLSDVWPLQKKSSLTHSFSSNTQLDILPPDEFADRESDDDVDDLTEDVAMCHIGSSFDDINDLGESASVMMFEASSSKRESTCYMSVNGGRSDDTTNASFDPESELETEELFEWPDTPMSRSSFTKNFIYRHKQKACMRNNSIAILENNTSPAGYLRMSKKRRKTFPAVMDQSGDHQDMPMCRESFSSGALSPFFTQSLPHEAELSGRFYQEDDLFSPHCSESRKSSKGSNLSSSPVRHHNIFSPKHYACDPGTANLFFGSDNDAGACDRGAQELSVVEESDPESVVWHPQEHSEITESGFDEELVDMESNTEGLSPIRSVPLKDPFIHITPPSPRSSRDSNINSGYNAEHTKPESDPEPYTRETKSDPEPQTQRKESAGDIQPKSRKSSVTTVMIVGSEQRILHSHSPDSATLERSHREISSTVSETPCLLPIVDTEQMEEDGTRETVREGQLTPLRALVSESSTSIQSLSPVPFEVTDLQSDSNHSLRSANTSQDIETKDEAATDNHVEKCSKAKSKNAQSFHNSRRAMMQPDTARRHSSSKIPEIKELLKLPADSTHKDPEEAPDHWARRRKLFKESRNRSSAGGSSITSNITDESDTMFSEDIRPVDVSMRDIEDRGFYTETFHCASWIYRGDDVSPSESPRCLSKRPKSVTIRERTVKITKGFGEYPWGFRIQFSKPIVVTEVDTNGAAEEAGLLVGDYVLAVNGTDVTSVPHSEAADLARQGPDLLTMIIGSDISRCPNTPRPACRGYLHKRTQSSLIKGWRKRWFVLRHDRCLYYYRHKRDEGKSQALSKLKLEGAEVEADTSLGKPFVFRCSPVSAGRVFYFCATSNQEMKRWLEAMSQAVQPVPQNHVWVDVTRHNSSMPPLAVKSPECLGMLHQLDRTKDVWVQNYCILKDGCLYFYASIRSTSALGGIYLHGYSVREQPLGAKRSTIELKPPSEECKTFHLCAENPTENKRWILALRASISKWVPLHRAIQDYMSKPPEVTRM